MAQVQETRTVRATYRSHAEAERAAEGARKRGFRPSLDSETDERAVLRAEMRDEVESTVAGPGNVGPFTKSMTRGILAWVPMGALVGAALGVLLALAPWGGGLSLGLRLVLGVAIGGFAGATAGFVAGGFARSRRDREGQVLDAEAGSIVSVRTESPDEARRARELLEAGDPMRIDEAADGAPVGPSSERKTKPVSGD